MRGAEDLARWPFLSSIGRWSRNSTRSEMSRAKLISCVTMTMVIPSVRSSRMMPSTSADEFWIERGGDLVEQEHIRPCREAAHDGDALLLPARELFGIGARETAEAEALEEFLPPRFRFGAANFVRLDRGERHVLEHAHVREQVVGLEDDADPLVEPDPPELSSKMSTPSSVTLPASKSVQPVDAARPASTCPSPTHRSATPLRAGAHDKIDAVEHPLVAIALGEARNRNPVHHLPPCRRRSRSLRERWSARRDSGTVASMNRIAAAISEE